MKQTAFSVKRVDFGPADIRTNRDIEYEAFSQVTSLLQRAERTLLFKDRLEGVSRNNSLWTALTVDLAHEHNKLAPEVRASLLSLGVFCIRYGCRGMNGRISLEPLIDINWRMMKGLRGDFSS